MPNPNLLPSPPKRPGAPRGNRNALKHGFYSRNFKPREATDLDQARPLGLQDEILMLRVFIRRLVESTQNLVAIPDLLEVLRVLSLASISLTRLIRTQYWINASGDSETAQTLQRALANLTDELNLYIDSPPK